MPHRHKLFAGRFHVRGLLGQGGMGVVLDAHDLVRDRPVAIKVLRESLADQPMVRARFAREARLLRHLDSPHVVRALEDGHTEGLPYIVLERLEGADLAEILEAEGRLPVPEAIEIARQACAALGDVHAAGIVHRDLKPENLFLTVRPDQPGPTLELLDFGIAKVDGPLSDEASREDPTLLAADEASMGTTVYMAPEQFDHPDGVDARADVWALGVLLYELLTGRLPFDGPTRPRIMMQVLTAEAAPPSTYDPRIPPELDRIVARCLSRDKNARWPSVDELDAALAPLTLSRRSVATPREPRVSMVRFVGQPATATGSAA